MKKRHTVIALCGAAVLTLSQPGVAFADELSPDANPGPLHYVALGDSYSSGEGAPFVPDAPSAEEVEDVVIHPNTSSLDDGWLGQTGNKGNRCHRSAHAYGVRVWGELDKQDPRWGISFRACSGALTTALWDEFKGEDPQLDAFDEGPADLITVGMGGNDAGFADIVEDCIKESVSNRYPPVKVLRFGACQEKWAPLVDERLPTLRASLRAAYSQLQQPERLKDGGKIIAVGFPRAFPSSPTGTCSLGTGSSLGEDTMRWLNEGVADRINTVISEEAAAAGISYINTSNYFSQFGRHDLCVDDGSERWINRVIPSDRKQSIHPKYQYHEKVATAVLACWAAEQTCGP